MKEARYYSRLDRKRVRCSLCPHGCAIDEGGTGLCGVRKNRDGTLFSLVWGRSIAASVDPIEKKPLFHFLPGSLSFSIATVGCNLKCSFCQNSDISQYPVHTGEITGERLLPEQVVETARARGCKSISYTYTEPTICLEYVLDTARLARECGLFNVMVTNGYISAGIVRGDLAGLIDAVNIDLKAFSNGFYRRLCSASLSPVLEAVTAYVEAGIWVEVTTLVIPGENDSPAELSGTARFIRSLSPDIPWHISRFYPGHRYGGTDPTPVESLETAREIGLAQGLKYVYTGNVAGHIGENTFCPGCGKQVIARKGFSVTGRAMKGSACPACGQIISGRYG